METKIKKRALIYGLAAILLVTVITAVSYDLGVYRPSSALFVAPPVPVLSSSFLTTFSSTLELKDFLATNSRTQGPMYFFSPSDINAFTKLGVLNAESLSGSVTAPSFAFDYSSTNIQVAGVDEADIVKTDGEYIYTISGNIVTIIDAYLSTSAKIMSRIVLDDLYPVGIFVKGNKLAVMGGKYSIPSALSRVVYNPYTIDAKMFMNVYDIQDRANPVLLRNLILTGSYFNSRMIGDYVYFVVSQPAYVVYDTVILPKFVSNGQEVSVNATDVHYRNETEDYFQLTTFVAVNLEDQAEAPTYMTMMLGGTSEMYVSLENMYITFPEWNEGETSTSIFRVHLEANNMTGEASGNITGSILDQFSMDEYNGYFRIAATSWINNTQQTSVYVLDKNLRVVGRLDGLGLNENFHTARFMGDKCYLVTFQKTDPLFAINLTDPTHPTVLGELKIPGYSDYLHPYDETHIIGVGKETQAAEEGFFAWYQGIKISLFDVSNMSDPQQLDSFVIGDRGSDSPVLADHKAFLFERSRNLMVIPVLVAKIDPSQYQGSVPPWAYGTPVWQGAYVFNVSLTDGFVLRGNITHMDGPYVYNSGLEVKRTLYIDNVLYTVSDKKIKMNSLDDLALIGEIDLS
jgi:uncharacterized secreted protein with C-terminal beta-propeller domain